MSRQHEIPHPVGARQRSDKYKQGRGRTDLAFPFDGVQQGDRLEVFVAGHFDYLGVQTYVDILRRIDLVDQILRHARLERVTSHEQSHGPGVPGQVHRGLSGGVSAPYHEHVPGKAGHGLGDR